MLTLILFLIFAGVAAGCWFQGLWPCAICVINMTFAALVATNLFEPACDYLDSNVDKGYTYVYDYLLIWIIFAMVYALLRAVTDGLSEHRVEFHPHVELGGRTFLSLWAGWIFLCFSVFALQTAPIPSEPFDAWKSPSESTFIMSSPDQQWAGFAFDRSRGGLSRGKFSAAQSHPQDKDVEPFDPDGSFAARYHDRRRRFEKMPGFDAT